MNILWSPAKPNKEICVANHPITERTQKRSKYTWFTLKEYKNIVYQIIDVTVVSMLGWHLNTKKRHSYSNDTYDCKIFFLISINQTCWSFSHIVNGKDKKGVNFWKVLQVLRNKNYISNTLFTYIRHLTQNSFHKYLYLFQKVMLQNLFEAKT